MVGLVLGKKHKCRTEGLYISPSTGVNRVTTSYMDSFSSHHFKTKKLSYDYVINRNCLYQDDMCPIIVKINDIMRFKGGAIKQLLRLI